MNEHTQEPKTTQAEEEETNDSSSRSPGVTDRGASNTEKASKDTEIKQPTQPNQTKSSSTEDKN
ncbi:hypothetical protein NIES2101_30370 [Calothrix sp. HK-06]|nr:hypothetical protein NIES2101_30370 [Calothrix sp. HK-06]